MSHTFISADSKRGLGIVHHLKMLEEFDLFNVIQTLFNICMCKILCGLRTQEHDSYGRRP